ncbi:MAG: tetratricopeptide repeat protein [Curvibacter sp.]|nr:tetratricopeptide repeat protein [Curvibacter sp.]
MISNRSISDAPSSTSSEFKEELARLEQLENYLKSDPSNGVLLLDAFDAALLAHQWDRAEFHLRHGQALRNSPMHWYLREADFYLAQGQVNQARNVLEALDLSVQADRGLADAVLQRLGWMDFQEQAFAACIGRLANRMENDPLSSVSSQLQQLWLRALHRTGELRRATEWIDQATESATLSPLAAGAAALISFDFGNFTRAQKEVDHCLQTCPKEVVPIEAWVAAASMALANQDASASAKFASEALKLNPRDGRSFSVLAFSELLAGDLKSAQQNFRKALSEMPGHVGTWHGLAWACILLRDLDGAWASLESALELDRNFAETHGSLAVVFALKQEREKALSCIERAHGLARANISAQYAQSILRGDVHDAESIRRLFDMVMSQQKLKRASQTPVSSS